MISILGGEGEHKRPSIRPRPMARHFSSFLADNASNKYGAAVSSATTNEVERHTPAVREVTPLQLLFQSIWERVEKVCVPYEFFCCVLGNKLMQDTVIASW